MRLEPTLALQNAVYARLSENDFILELGLDANGNPRVYDRVPKGRDGKPVAPPYYRIGNRDQDVPNKAEGYDGSEVFLQIDAYGDREQVGKPGVKRMVAAAVEALDECEEQIDIDDYRLQVLEKHNVEFLTEGDGLTERAIMTFRAMIEPK